MKESVFCSDIMMELRLGTLFDSVPVFTDIISALRVAGNRTYSSRVKQFSLWSFFIQELIKEGTISIKGVRTEDQLAEIGTNYLSKHIHRYFIKLIRELQA